jgi:hypothetical protein
LILIHNDLEFCLGWRNKLPQPGEVTYEVIEGESKAQKIAEEMSEREMFSNAEKYKVYLHRL